MDYEQKEKRAKSLNRRKADKQYNKFEVRTQSKRYLVASIKIHETGKYW